MTNSIEQLKAKKMTDQKIQHIKLLSQRKRKYPKPDRFNDFTDDKNVRTETINKNISTTLIVISPG